MIQPEHPNNPEFEKIDYGTTSTGAILPIKTVDDGTGIGDKVITLDGEKVKPNALKVLSANSYDVDSSAVLVLDASANTLIVAVTIANAGVGDIYLYFGNTASSTNFFKKLSAGETWEYPVSYTSDTTNDIYAIRASDETNDNVITISWGEA